MYFIQQINSILCFNLHSFYVVPSHMCAIQLGQLCCATAERKENLAEVHHPP